MGSMGSALKQDDRTLEATINAITKIAETAGFALEDDTSGVDLRFGYRDESDIADEVPSLASRQLARHVKREILAAFPTATVEAECVDEWISMLVTLPGNKPEPRYGSPEYWARERAKGRG